VVYLKSVTKTKTLLSKYISGANSQFENSTNWVIIAGGNRLVLAGLFA
jgi:hypothetical protein